MEAVERQRDVVAEGGWIFEGGERERAERGIWRDGSSGRNR